MLYPNVWEGTAMSRHINKAELISKVRQLAGLTNDEKSALLELLNEKKIYGLVWENHEEAVEEQLREQLPVFREVPERRILSDDTNAPNHIIIEAENLHALVALTYTHEGKIDIIYIDPPYNRGEDDFMYNDRYIDKENPFKHSLWLSFIRKRLDIAKKLLSPTGVMIVHIDEHEFDALHMLLENDIFSEKENLGLIVWNKLNPKGDPHAVSVMHEYVLLFCKNKEAFVQQANILTIKKPNAQKIIDKAKSLFSKIGKEAIPDDINEILKNYNLPNEVKDLFKVKYDLETINNEFAFWLKKSNFKDGEKAYCFIDENGDAFQPVSMAWPNKETPTADYFIPLIHPINKKECPVPTKGWRNPSSTMARLLGEGPVVELLPNMVIKGEVVFTTNKKGVNNQPRRKYLLKDNMAENTPSIYNDGSSDDDLFYNLGIQFPYPKPMNAAQYFLKAVHPNPKIILDFFAGSGTTLHATMQLNAEDGGQRQCILVTNNENGICEKVTYERNKRVIQGYTTPKGEQVEGLTKNNLRYYKADFISREPSSKNKRELVKAATDLLCIKENLYEEVKMTCNGKTLRKDYARRFADGEKEMIIIYEPAVIKYIVEELKTWGQKEFIKIYVFSEGRYAYDDDFKDVIEKVTLCALPDAIYQAYRRVLPHRKKVQQVETMLDDEEMKEALADAESYSYQEKEGGKA